MQKTILITGATDGIGLETAKMLVNDGHRVLIHGRNPAKLNTVEQELKALNSAAVVESYIADLSMLMDVEALVVSIMAKYQKLDALINNAGVYKVSQVTTMDNLDSRFVVNTIAPYLLTQRLLPLLVGSGRVVNVSSAAQSPVNLTLFASEHAGRADGTIYAQSKLAITMWTAHMAHQVKDQGVSVVSVNPASMLGSKLVKEAYGVSGGDLKIGADILYRAALSDEFADASGKYYDNDRGQFGPLHPDAQSVEKTTKLVELIESILAEKTF